MTEKEQIAYEMMVQIANDIKEKLPEHFGFALLAYDFEHRKDKNMLYISNSNREDVIKAMLEFLQKNLDDPTMYGKDVD